MTDYFSLLKQPRRPWLDDDGLHKAFLNLTKEVHPDRFHQSSLAEQAEAKQRSIEINAAYNCLHDPRSRLLHLLQLETGSSPREIQEIPHETTDLFMLVGSLCHATDRFLDQNAKPASPLLQVQWFHEVQELREKLSHLQARLTAWRESLLGKLKDLNLAWENAPIQTTPPPRSSALPLDELEQLYRLLSYETRWTTQIQERIFQLTV